MKTKITKKFLKEIKPSQDPVKVFDTDLRGFLLRVQPSGYSCYYVECRNSAGRKVTYRIGPADRLTLAEAREEAQGAVVRLRQGEEDAARQLERLVCLRRQAVAETRELLSKLGMVLDAQEQIARSSEAAWAISPEACPDPADPS